MIKKEKLKKIENTGQKEINIKKKYTTPRIIDHGKLKNITLGESMGTGDTIELFENPN